MLRRLGRLALPLSVVASIATCICQAQTVQTHHVRPSTKDGSAKLVGHMPADQIMHLVIVLPLRNQDALNTFLKDVYDPGSPLYRHFLTADEFTSRFGPTQEDYDAAVQFATQNGLTVTGTSRDRLNLDVSGTVAKVEKAFNVKMNVYQHPTEARTFYAPDREPTTYLPFPLWRIAGLDNYSIPQPAGLHKNPHAGTTSNATTGSGPSNSFLGSDMRAAYYGGTNLTGSGQTLGLLEFVGTDLADVNTYYKNVGQTNNVPISLVPTDNTSTSCLYSAGCDDTEQTLDITQALGMAPGLKRLDVYVGSTDASILNKMAQDGDAQLSCSWAWRPADPSVDDPYFAMFAADGQNFFVATGDSGKWPTRRSPYYYPAEDANVTAVGGTDLSTSGTTGGGPWKAETAWADGGGGISPDHIAIPSWQQSTATSCSSCSSSYRNTPDVSANANFTFYVCANQTTCTANLYGGTSFAAPMWAGYMALVNEQSVTNRNGLVGFINPSLYMVGNSGDYSTDFHDITNGSNGYSATSGFDLATGWGSPNGLALIDALAGVATTSFSLSASPTSLSVAAGAQGTASISFSPSSFSGTIGLTATVSPAGPTVSFDLSSISSTQASSTMTVTVPSGTAAGTTYTVTVTGKDGNGTTATTTVTVTVSGFSLSASGPVPLTQGGTGTTTITSTSFGNFSSDITLSVDPTSLPAGVSVLSYNPNPIVAGSSSVITFSAAANATTGTFNIPVTGVSGSTTATTTVTLTVTSAAQGYFSLSPSSQSISVARGSSGQVNIGASVTGTLGSPISLSASGQPGGVTISFTPASIPASGGQSTMTVSVTNGGGSHAITITGMSGGIAHSITVNLNVTK